MYNFLENGGGNVIAELMVEINDCPHLDQAEKKELSATVFGMKLRQNSLTKEDLTVLIEYISSQMEK